MVTSHTDNRQCKTYCCTGYDKNGGRENNFTDTNQRRLDGTMIKFELLNKVNNYFLY